MRIKTIENHCYVPTPDSSSVRYKEEILSWMWRLMSSSPLILLSSFNSTQAAQWKESPGQFDSNGKDIGAFKENLLSWVEAAADGGTTVRVPGHRRQQGNANTEASCRLAAYQQHELRSDWHTNPPTACCYATWKKPQISGLHRSTSRSLLLYVQHRAPGPSCVWNGTRDVTWRRFLFFVFSVCSTQDAWRHVAAPNRSELDCSSESPCFSNLSTHSGGFHNLSVQLDRSSPSGSGI